MKRKGHRGSTELYSRTIKAGSRQYYIDAKIDRQGNRYLVLSETKLSPGTSSKERHRIFVYEEDLTKFAEALSDVREHLASYEPGEQRQESSRGYDSYLENLLSINVQGLDFEE